MTPNGIPVRNFVENQGSHEQVLGAGEETGKSREALERKRKRKAGSGVPQFLRSSSVSRKDESEASC